MPANVPLDTRGREQTVETDWREVEIPIPDPSDVHVSLAHLTSVTGAVYEQQVQQLALAKAHIEALTRTCTLLGQQVEELKRMLAPGANGKT
jgi:hypothetical protein